MKVTLSVLGRFHLFNLARQLQEHGALGRLITSYPVFETVKYGIDKKYIKSLVLHEILNRIGVKFPQSLRQVINPQYSIFELFDLQASWQIPKETDIFVGLSSGSLHSLRRAKARGITTVLERGSSHMLYQRQILTEEYERHGLKLVVVHPKVVEKELKEYVEADYISIPSQYVRNTFVEFGVNEDKLIQVPYGVNLTNFYPVPKQDKVFRVIHCGNTSLRKGVHYLLQAWAELQLPGAELWLIGPLSDEMRPFLQRYDSPAIRHLGPFPETELYKYYSQGSVFCLASIEEGMAMVQAQAMACGLPAIITTNTGGADIVRDGVDGFVIPIREVAALKEKLLYFYENPEECRRMGESARQRVQTGFSWTDYGNRMMAEYQRILR